MTEIRLGNELGDLFLSWEGARLDVVGTHSTKAEQEKLRALVDKHGLIIEGDLHGTAVITGTEESLRAALNDFLGREAEERRQKGYILYGIPKKGRFGKGKGGKKGVVLQFKEQVDAGVYEEIAAAPGSDGG